MRTTAATATRLEPTAWTEPLRQCAATGDCGSAIGRALAPQAASRTASGNTHSVRRRGCIRRTVVGISG